jgi:N-acetyl-gamma-glutamyl-phosphate/LysW-gamma-L-alpha-aminoadipyl-6-phosphate reductase
VKQVTSERLDGQFVHFTHPNLRKRTQLKFVRSEAIEKCDLLFLGLPHGSAMGRIDQLSTLADRIVDLSADFRLRDVSGYDTWYGKPHANPAWLSKFVWPPELHVLSSAATYESVGRNATATTLIWPLAAGLIDVAGVIAGSRFGGSEGAPHRRTQPIIPSAPA